MRNHQNWSRNEVKSLLGEVLGALGGGLGAMLVPKGPPGPKKRGKVTWRPPPRGQFGSQRESQTTNFLTFSRKRVLFSAALFRNRFLATFSRFPVPPGGEKPLKTIVLSSKIKVSRKSEKLVLGTILEPFWLHFRSLGAPCSPLFTIFIRPGAAFVACRFPLFFGWFPGPVKISSRAKVEGIYVKFGALNHQKAD